MSEKNDNKPDLYLTADSPGLDSIAWDLDWNLLRTFMVIAQEQNITRAAQQLNQKQPSVSNALRRLEEKLGCQLAERGPRSFKMTHHGEALFQECKELFGTVGRLPNIIQDVHDNVQGHIKILMTSQVITPLLDETLRTFHEKNPKATFSISVRGSQEVIEALHAKEGTLGICLIREPLENLTTQLLYREHFGFFCGRNHPLFGKTDISMEDLRGQQRVTFYTDRLGDVLHPIAVLRGQAQLSDAVTGVSNNLEEVRRMIMAGLGIGPLPIHVVERDILMGRLWPLLPVEEAPAVDVYTLQNPRAVLNAAEKEFLKLLDQKIRDIPLTERTYGNIPYPQPL
ncbi:LysR family transcriptional regulator [Emcibacter sp.]|uniref:LysR family transcriptional regulator n=1 Tax=Emcibacter sp. TaxID=1979954 RepID=UPI002AA8646E|nr:LysR family transcriptional regulator [Emcibacter sp.]